MTTPPSAGPAMRAMLNRLELSAIAFGSSSRPTIWNVSDWRAGASSTSAVSTQSGDRVDVPRRRMARHGVDREHGAQRHLHRLRDDHRLAVVEAVAMTPAKRPKIVNGPKRQKERIPIATGSCVSVSTNQYMAMFCIHVR
jgi:hypothetical protein